MPDANASGRPSRFRLDVTAEHAMFTPRELKTEPRSYQVPTYAALRGMLTSVFWHPGLDWVVDSVHVINPVRYDSVMRNGTKNQFPAASLLVDARERRRTGPMDLLAHANHTQVLMQHLVDVRYVVAAHIDVLDSYPREPGVNPLAKSEAIFERRARAGAYGGKRKPYLGKAYCQCEIRLMDDDEPDPEGVYDAIDFIDMGVMHHSLAYDIDEARPPQRVASVAMRNGVIDFGALDVVTRGEGGRR